MTRSQDVFETLAAALVLAVLVAVMLWTSMPDLLFVVFAAAAAGLYIACYLAPRAMRRIISVPAAFHLGENWGVRGFDMQAVSYASFHTTRLAWITHTGFALDGAAWLILTGAYLGWIGIGAVVVVKIIQIISYGERRLAAVLAGAWTIIGLGAWLVWILAGATLATSLAAGTVVTMAVWRTVGHVTEPIPPWVSGSQRFVPLEDLGIKPTMGLSFLTGMVAEFASGVPFRLFDFWAYDVLLRHLGFRSDHVISYVELDRQREAIFEHGLRAAPATAHIDPAAA